MEFEWLSQRVMRPKRADKPVVFTPDPRRRFRTTELVACPRCNGRGTVGGYDMDMRWEDDAWTCGDCGTIGSIAAQTAITDQLPVSVATVLGQDPEGVARAEAAARLAVEHLVGWGVPGTDRIVWRVGGPLPAPMRATMPHPHAEVIRQLFSDQRNLGRVRGPNVFRPDQHDAFVKRAVWHLNLDTAWRRASEQDLTVPSTVDRPQVAGRSFAELGNPFAAIVEVWAAGYAFADIVDDAIHLIAPDAVQRALAG